MSNTYLQGRKIAAAHDQERPSVEVLHLIRKLRWMGMEEEAAELQMKLCDTASTGAIVTGAHETD